MPLSVTAALRTPLSAVTLPANGSVACSARVSGCRPPSMIASGAGRSTSSSTVVPPGFPRPPKSRSASNFTYRPTSGAYQSVIEAVQLPG